DDLGGRDTTLYGSSFYETPNIDALAERGMMFTQAYAAAPICSPTRASILTGLFPARIGITTPSGHVAREVLEKGLQPKAPPAQKAMAAMSVTRLSQDYHTLAEAFRDAGYATGHFGKWHLGVEPYDPLHHGFDVDIPHTPAPGPSGGYLGPWQFWPGQGAEGEHIEDRMAIEAGRFMREHKDRPFFLNYWAFSVHSPFEGKPELVERYRAKADPNHPQRNPINGAMVHSLDEAVGHLTRTLDELGIAEETIVIFFSDNGGIHFRDDGGAPITSNAPLRGGKATIYEGGTREPLIVIWPGEVEGGSRSEAIVSSIDFYPTLLEMTGITPKPDQRFDGISIVGALRGQPLERDTIFCHHPHYTKATGHVPSTYVRRADWKLIRFYADGEDQRDRYELYNLKDDLGESRNRVREHRAKVRELGTAIDSFLLDTAAVIPQPNPRYREP
ncbi:MAG: sulfatase, partial [bacterium]|nr:sulfatase [bacterium]